MVKIPEWRVNPFVNCLTVHELPEHQECIVQFQTQGGNFTSFVPKRYVIPDGKYLYAAIIADVADGVLVDIPAETLTSGPRLLVRNSEMDSVLTFEDWTVKNGSQ